MLGNLTGWHLIALLAIILLLFGAAKLPALAKSLGQSARVFRGEIKEMKKDSVDDAPAQNTTVVPDAPTVTRTVSDAPDTHEHKP
ncbi:Sec-independent protein translocase subunit TatA [Microbacterium sp. NPDC091313]